MNDKKMIVFKDGDAWCFTLPDFKDLQESPSIWTHIPLDAFYKELIKQKEYLDYIQKQPTSFTNQTTGDYNND